MIINNLLQKLILINRIGFNFILKINKMVIPLTIFFVNFIKNQVHNQILQLKLHINNRKLTLKDPNTYRSTRTLHKPDSY